MTLVTLRQASEMCGISVEALHQRVRLRHVPVHRRSNSWPRIFLDKADVAYLRPRLRFPAGDDECHPVGRQYFPVAPLVPLVDQLALNLGSQRQAMCHLAASTAGDPDAWERAWCRAKRSGTFTVTQADRWATALGRSMSELWPEAV